MGRELQGKTILVVDDDVSLCQAVELVLVQEDAQVYQAYTGRNGLRQFFEHRPDLVILDIHMPEMDGWETLRQIRLLAETPVILLTTLNANEAVARGLDNGADDFISKPFDTAVLLARVRAVLRRTQSSTEQNKPVAYSDDHLTIDLVAHQVFVAGEPINLTVTEFRLLSYLLQHAGQVLTYQQILEHVWGQNYRDSIDYVHVYLSHLRRKLEKDARKPRYLLTERGVGCRFERRQRD